MRRITSLLFSLVLMALCASSVHAEVTVWVRAQYAPYLYRVGVDSGHGTQATAYSTTSDNQKWWVYVFQNDDNISNLVLNNGYDGDNNKSRYIPNVSGTVYLIYNSSDFVLNVTEAKDAADYAFLEPYARNIDWEKDGATLYAEGKKMVMCGGYNNGNNTYLWTSNNAPNSNITFQRRNSNGTETWNSFSSEYVMGGYYAPTNWDAGAKVSSDYQSIVFPEALVVNEENFPDANFRSAILNKVAAASDNLLTSSEIAGITSLDLSNSNISDLTGIENFTALTTLNVSGNHLTSFDISGTAITSLTATGQTVPGVRAEVTNIVIKEGQSTTTYKLYYFRLSGSSGSSEQNLKTSLDDENFDYTKATWTLPTTVVNGTASTLRTPATPNMVDPSSINGSIAVLSPTTETESAASGTAVYNYDCGNNQTMGVTLNWNANPAIPTGLKDLVSTKTVTDVTYVNLAGQMSKEPFNGVNIVVKHFSDGSKVVEKMLK